MAFALTSESIPRISSFEGAEKHVDTTIPWPRFLPPKDNEVPLHTGRRTYMGARRGRSGEIIFRYHGTDLVTWHSPTRLTVDMRYTSLSSCTFADTLTPAGMSFSLDPAPDGDPMVTLTLWGGVRKYLTPAVTTYVANDDEWVPEDASRMPPFVKPVARRAERKAALAEVPEYSRFRIWAAAVTSSRKPGTYDSRDRWAKLWLRASISRHRSSSEWLTMLRDKGQWMSLLDDRPADWVLSELRKSIYTYLGVDAWVNEELLFLGGDGATHLDVWKEYQTYRGALSRKNAYDRKF